MWFQALQPIPTYYLLSKTIKSIAARVYKFSINEAEKYVS